MPGTAAGVGLAYRPRSPSNALKDIVEDHLGELLRVWDERFRKDHGPFHPRLEKLFEAFGRCGDPHHGFLRLRCPGCAFERLVPFSCKARGLCPSCQKKRAIAWAERMVEEVLPHLLRSWVHSGFHVNSDRRVEAGDRRGLESLLEYMERAPVALERLTYRPDGRVLYRGKFHPVLGTDHRLVAGEEFLALLVPHVLLRYECVIRCYGAASTAIRKKFGWIKKKTGEIQPQPPAVPVLKGEESGFVKVRRRNWARLIMKVWLDDPEVCPKCGERMKVLAAISSPSQDGVIEKILRARGEWNPPWLRAKPPRGPPPANAGPGGSPSVGTRIEYEEGYDPNREDWEFDRDPEGQSAGPNA